MSTYVSLKTLSRLMCVLPAKVKKIIALYLGKLVWFATPLWRKRLAVAQVSECLNVSDEKAQEIAKKSVLKYGNMIVEFLCFPLLNKENIRKKVIITEEERIRKYFDDGKSFVLATAHFGNWELLGAACALYEFPLASVAQALNDKNVDKFINEQRSLVGQNITYKTGVVKMAHMLDAGYALGLLTDQDAGAAGVKIDFFGRESSCPKGSAALARLKKVPLVLMLLFPNDDETYELYVSPEIPVAYSEDREKDIKDATIILMKYIEDAIKKAPEQWFWLHNRWKVDRKQFKGNKYKGIV